MTFHTFYEYENDLRFELNWSNYYRSSLSRKVVKHCFESTLLETSPEKSHQVGFTWLYNERSFLSFYQYSSGILLFLSSESKTYLKCNIEQDIDETIELCFDSIKSQFIIIKNEQKCNQTINNLPKAVTWFLYLDHSQYSAESVEYSKVLINAGKHRFINKLPEGFKKWFNNENNKTCKQFNINLLKYLLISVYMK